MTLENYTLEIEITAVVLNLTYVILAAYEKRSCWIFGGIGSLISVWLFYVGKLPSEAFLYFFYFIMAIIGYFNWIKPRKELSIHWSGIRGNIIYVFLSILFSIGFYFFSSALNGMSPGIDAFTTGFSIVATIMVIRKAIENWIYWVVIDILSVYLYFTREYNIYAILMISYTILAIFGYLKWKKKIELA